MAGQSDAGIAGTLDQVEHADRQAGFGPALHGQLGDFRGQLAGLEDHRVASQQRRNDMPVGQVAGEVVRAEHSDHAMRLVPQHGGGIGQRAALLAGALAMGLYRDGDLVDHAGHFGGGFPQRLAGFLADGAGQNVGLGLQGSGELLQDGDALLHRAPRPGRESGTRGGDGTLDLRRRSSAAGPDNGLAHRVERLQQLTLTCQPFTGDIQTRHHQAPLLPGGISCVFQRTAAPRAPRRRRPGADAWRSADRQPANRRRPAPVPR
ncbi:hypothetical protein D9M71_390040 [compost metagenome]